MGGSVVEGKVPAVTVPAVRLFPFLQARYSDHILANICVLKIDTEGHDVVILSDLPAQFRPPVVWVEWFKEYQFADIKTFLLEVRKYNILSGVWTGSDWFNAPTAME